MRPEGANPFGDLVLWEGLPSPSTSIENTWGAQVRKD